jgi:hypothetical protein
VAQIGRVLLMMGAVLAAVGVLLVLGDKLGLGRLPGDIVLRRKNGTVYFPIVTSIVLSIVLTVILNLIVRRK